MGRVRRGFALRAVCVVAVGLVVSSASAETLNEALAKAYQGNPNLLAARASLRAVDEGVAQALSGWRPTLSVNFDIGKSRVDTRTTSGTQSRTPRAGSVVLDQNLYRGGRTQAATLGAEQDVLAARARLASTEQEVMLDAATAYVDVLRDQAVLELNQNNERVLTRQLEATRDRFQVGEVTRTDVAQAESRLSRTTADRIQSEGDLVSSRAAYRDVIGELPGKLEPAKPLDGLPATQESALSQARNDNPNVIAARFDERAAFESIKQVTGELFPTVGFEGEISRREELSSTSSRTDAGSITARFSVPLYQAGGVSSRIRESKQVHSQRRRELDAAVRAAIADATRAWESLQTARAQIQAFSTGVRASSIALEGVRQEAQVGSRTVLDVLDAEQELLTAQVSLVRAQRDEVVATFDVRRRVGTLLATKLGLAVSAYDFEAYYKRVRNKWFGLGTGKE